jgi:hypothetical protein
MARRDEIMLSHLMALDGMLHTNGFYDGALTLPGG